ncbi:hypothetical protein BDE36_2773 [Arcticibacter tournemirensis]|nr:hypothetical protein BDE36_2773 [Arcticibacter tournemirensis]
MNRVWTAFQLLQANNIKTMLKVRVLISKHGLLTHSLRNMDANVVTGFKKSYRLGTEQGEARFKKKNSGL